MEVEVTTLTRRGAAVMRRSHRVSAERVHFGRGTDNEVSLADIRVELSAAVLYQQDGGLYVENTGTAPLRVDGQSVSVAPVKLGSEIQIGPYKITIGEAPPDHDVAIAVELAQPMGDAMVRLMSEVRIGLSASALSKRAVSWTGFVIIAIVCLVVPIVVYSMGLIPSWHKTAPVAGGPVTAVALSWNAGTFSNAHRFFAANCTTCHQASFTAVADNACLSCHGAKLGHHVPAGADIGPLRAELDTTRCTTCHEEHRGIEGTVITSSNLCVACHRSLAESAPKSPFRDVSGFPGGHPEFKATVIADAAQGKVERILIGGNPAPVDHPNIKFSHKAHLDTIGAKALGDRAVKGCSDCHVRDSTGMGFLPITYKDRCQSCHALTFDRVDLPWPDAKVPHGDDSGVVAAVWNYYAGKALQGAVRASATPTPAILRRAAGAPGEAPIDGAKPDALAWVRQKTETALRDIVLEDKRGCAYCHFGTGANGAFDTAKVLPAAIDAPMPAPARIVAPVMLRSTFLPNAAFNHARHEALACADCHASKTSQSSGDVLIPGIENCLGCHGAENATLRAGSSCVSCHYFHRSDFGPMRTMTAVH